MIELLRPVWPEALQVPGNIGVAVTTRGAHADAAMAGDEGFGGFNLGHHVGDDAQQVARRRESLRCTLGVQAVQWLTQVHGTEILTTSPTLAAASLHQPPEVDAACTTHAGLALAIMTADCVPVVLLDRQGRWIAAAHAGWRGLVQGILPQLLQRLVASSGIAAGHWLAWIGPTISAAHYEVGDEVATAVQAIGAAAADVALRPRSAPGKWSLDLVGLARWQLQQEGVARVLASEWCSYADQRFYSYRRATHTHGGRGPVPATGRMATLIWRQPDAAIKG